MKFFYKSDFTGQSSFQELLKEAKETSENFYAIVALGDLLKLFKDGLLVPYSQNRSGNINRSRIKEMATNFNPSGFGQVTVAFHGGKLELVDAHHRIYTLEFMNDVLLTFGGFAATTVCLHVVPSSERLSTYQTLNAGKSHGGLDKIGNTELAVGSINHEVLVDAGIEEDFKKGHKQNLADLLVTFDDHGPNFEIEDLFATRSKVNKLLDLAKDRRSFSVKDSTMKKTTGFTQKYQSLVNMAEADDVKSEVVQLINSSGFFLTMGLDYMSNGRILTGFSTLPNKDILKKISGKRFPKIKEQTRTVARRNRLEISIPELKKCFV